MCSFANEATSRNINFGFYSLNMNMNQIKKFIYGTELEPYQKKFHSLIYHPDFSKIKIKGKYLRVDGKIFDFINTKRE
jgi:hypothetical protein